MDLTALLLRVAARRPHVLLVPTPGASRIRFAFEAEIARRHWPAAANPADTDLLVVAGTAGPAMGAVVDAVWAQVPAPRVRVAVVGVDDVAGALDAGARALADADTQRAAAQPAHTTGTDGVPVDPGPHDHDTVGGHGHDTYGAPRHDQGPHGHGDHAEPREGQGGYRGPEGHAGHGDGGHEGHGEHGEHGGHGGHHGHGEGMPLPGGLAMADLGEDRDGLTLDRLHVALGPVLPDWPAGLVVRATLQGDVIQEASAEVLDPVTEQQHHDHHREGTAVVGSAAMELDGLARFLAVAGWADAAMRCRRLRDHLLTDGPNDQVVGDALTLLARVRRSRVLRWSLRGLWAGAGELTELLDQRLARVHGVLEDAPAGLGSTVGVEELPALLVGAELAAARLIVAAVDPQTETLHREEVAHG